MRGQRREVNHCLGVHMKLTKDQQRSLLRKWKQDDQGLTYLQFRRTVMDYGDFVMVCWCGMYLGVEACGYCHS